MELTDKERHIIQVALNVLVHSQEVITISLEEISVLYSKIKNDAKFVKVGDRVMWRGAWGTEPEKEAVVTRMEITEYPRQKEGKEVEIAKWSEVFENRVVFDLDNHCWAYGEQIFPMP